MQYLICGRSRLFRSIVHCVKGFGMLGRIEIANIYAVKPAQKLLLSLNLKIEKRMRTLFLFLVACTLSQPGSSQNRLKEVTHYLFPEFTKGNVLLKSGMKQQTLLNYNALTEEMIFDNQGKKLTIGPVGQIDTIYIEGRKFIPFKEKFVEILFHHKFDLYAQYKCSIVDPGKPAAYGGTSQTSSVTSYSSYMSGGQVYELALPEGIQTKPYTEYWLQREGKVVGFVNLRQLAKQFSDKSDQFRKYVKENKVTYEDEDSLVSLVKYMEEQ